MQTSILSGLNEAQTEAVTHREGPLMIIAGAGTGKTRVITSRIAYLINEAGIDPQNILALTFTEKAAAEMESRVDGLMPLSYEEVKIGTFHAFCDSILRESGIFAGIDPGYKILNRPGQWLLFKKHMFDFDLEIFRPPNNPSKFIAALLTHFSRLKDEDIRPESYLEHANALQLAATDDAEKEEAAKASELARTYQKYQQIKISGGVLDFGDLNYYALRLLENSPSVLANYRNRYRFILVDEYQDTNYVQNKLVALLAGERANITVVGDDDQSIYKWRGASLSNLLSFERNFPSVKKVVLNDNYRSAQKILDLSHAIIINNNPERLEIRAGIDKRLKAANDFPNSILSLDHHPDYFTEARNVCLKILDLNKEGASFKDVAVLVRANQHALPFTEIFRREGVPFNVRDTQSPTRFPEIKDLLSMLEFIVRPHNDVAAARLLSMEIFGIPMSEVADVFKNAREDGYKPVFYYLRDLFRQDSIGGEDYIDLIRRVYILLDNMLDFSRRENVARILGEFLDKSGLFRSLSEDTLLNADKIRRIARLLETARDFEFEGGEQNITTFLDYIHAAEEAGGFADDSSFADEDAVSVLTVHSAKGLEFDHVFIPCLVAQRFPATGKRDPIEVPDSLIDEEIDQKTGNLAEERRLFYVACTRAKKNLFMSYSDKYEGNKKWKVSPFVTEAVNSGLVKENETQSTKEGLSVAAGFGDDTGYFPERRHSGLETSGSDGNVSMREVKESNTPARLSYSQMDTFETCPLKYRFRYLFKIPSPCQHAANFGTSVHDTVNRFFRSLEEGSKPSLDLLMDLYDKCWIPYGYLNKAHENTRKEKGRAVMEKFYIKEAENGFKIPAYMERNFRLKVGGVWFSGRIDRIDRLPDGGYEVVDYKTGTSKKDADLKKDLQLSVYAMACRDVFRLKATKFSLYFLEDAIKVSTTRSDEDIEKVRLKMEETVNEIGRSDFEAAPGFHCGYCEYRLLCDKAA